MDLDFEELRATRRANGSDGIIMLKTINIDKKIKQLMDWLELKTSEYDNEQYAYIKGQIDILNEIRNGELE